MPPALPQKNPLRPASSGAPARPLYLCSSEQLLEALWDLQLLALRFRTSPSSAFRCTEMQLVLSRVAVSRRLSASRSAAACTARRTTATVRASQVPGVPDYSQPSVPGSNAAKHKGHNAGSNGNGSGSSNAVKQKLWW